LARVCQQSDNLAALLPWSAQSMATGLTGATGEIEVVSPGVVQMSSSFARNKGQVPSSAPDKIFSQKMK
jgi:hypothetical protein